MKRRLLIQKLLGVIAVLPFCSKLAAKEPAAKWKYRCVNTKSIPMGLSIDGGITHICDELTAITNRLIEEARSENEPLGRVEFSWRRIRRDNEEDCFVRIIAMRDDKSLGSISALPNGTYTVNFAVTQ